MNRRKCNDPFSQLSIMVGSDHYFHTYRPYVLTFQNQLSIVNIVIATGGTMGLAEWIIDETYLVEKCFKHKTMHI